MMPLSSFNATIVRLWLPEVRVWVLWGPMVLLAAWRAGVIEKGGFRRLTFLFRSLFLVYQARWFHYASFGNFIFYLE